MDNHNQQDASPPKGMLPHVPFKITIPDVDMPSSSSTSSSTLSSPTTQQHKRSTSSPLTPPLPSPSLGVQNFQFGNIDRRAKSSVSGMNNPRATTATNSAQQKTPAQFVLQNLFAQFVKTSETKIQELLLKDLDREIDLATPLRPQVDIHFDNLLQSLGSIAKHCPRLIVDSIMVWRKSKSDNVDLVTPLIVNMYPAIKPRDLEQVLKERKSLLSNFILCRALIEIIQRLKQDTFPNDLAEKLEEMVFGQLKSADPDLLQRYPNRQANLDFFAQVTGYLSNIRFATVSDRFIKEISQGNSSGSSSMKENKLEMLIRSMRFLRLKIYPMDALEETADFISILSDFFANAKTERIKNAYSDLFIELMEPIAAVAVAEINVPMWMKAVESVYAKASKLATKPRHMQATMGLISTLLTVSRRDFFHQKLHPFLETLYRQLKENKFRHLVLACLLRLLWVYLFRHPEQPTSQAHRTVETMMKTMFPLVVKPKTSNSAYSSSAPGPSFVPSLEVGLDYLTLATWFVGCKYRDIGIQVILSIAGATGSTLAGEPDESLVPERIIVAIRSMLLLLKDLEEAVSKSGLVTSSSEDINNEFGGGGGVYVEGKLNVRQPPFPSVVRSAGNMADLVTARKRELENGMDSSSSSSSSANMTTSAGGTTPTSTEDQSDQLNDPLPTSVLHKMGQGMRDAVEKMNDVITQIAMRLDALHGSNLFYGTNDLVSLGVGVRIDAGGNVVVGNDDEDDTDLSQFGFSAGNGGLRRGSVGEFVVDVVNNGGSTVSSSSSSSSSSITSGFSTVGSSSGLTTISSSAQMALANFNPAIREKQVMMELMRMWVDALPRLVPTGLGPNKTLELLSRYTLNADDGLRAAAMEALKRIARIKDKDIRAWWLDKREKSEQPMQKIGIVAEKVATTLMQTVMTLLNDRFAEWGVELVIGKANNGFEVVMMRVFHTYCSLLDIWIQDLKVLVEEGNVLDKEAINDAVEEIESRGLLALFSVNAHIRKVGIMLLRKARTMYQFVLDPTQTSMQSKLARSREARKSIRRTMTRMQRHRTLVLNILEDRGAELVEKHFVDPVLVTSSRSEQIKLQQEKLQLHSRGSSSSAASKSATGLSASQQQEGNAGSSSNNSNNNENGLSKDALIIVFESDDPVLTQVRLRCLPEFFKFCFDFCSPKTISSALLDALQRVTSLYPVIVSISEQPFSNLPMKWGNSVAQLVASGGNKGVPSSIASMAQSLTCTIEEVVELWKIHLIFVCSVIEVSRYDRSIKLMLSNDPSSRMMGSSLLSSAAAAAASSPLLKRFVTPAPTAPVVLSKREEFLAILRTPRRLFSNLLPLLSCERVSIRKAVVLALGSVNELGLDGLFEEIQPNIKKVIDDIRARAADGLSASGGSSGLATARVAARQRAGSTSGLGSAAKGSDRLRIELTYLLSMVADAVKYDNHRRNERLMFSIIGFAREVGRLLSDPEIQLEWDHQMLRYYFCIFVQRFYENLALVSAFPDAEYATGALLRGQKHQSHRLQPSRHNQQYNHHQQQQQQQLWKVDDEYIEKFFPFDLRYFLFKLFEGWCGFGQMGDMTREREAKMMQRVLDQIKDFRDRGNVTSTMEEQRKALEMAALKAMSSLCKGSVMNPSGMRSNMNMFAQAPPSFDMRALFQWIDSVFASPDERLHTVAKNALENLLLHNQRQPALFEDIIKLSFMGNPLQNSTKGYFLALVENVTRLDAEIRNSWMAGTLGRVGNSQNALMDWLWKRRCQLLNLAIFKGGDPNLNIRKGAGRLLKVVENVLSSKYEQEYEPSGYDENGEMIPSDDEARTLTGEEEEMKRYEVGALTSDLPIVFKSGQSMISARFAENYAEITNDIVCEMVLRLEMIASSNSPTYIKNLQIKDILMTMAPWMRNIVLSYQSNDDFVSTPGGHPRSVSEVILTNMFYLTVRYSDQFLAEIESLWVSLIDNSDARFFDQSIDENQFANKDRLVETMNEQNVESVVEFMLRLGLKSRNPSVVGFAKKVVVCIGRTAVCRNMMDSLMRRIMPRLFVPPTPSPAKLNPADDKPERVVTLGYGAISGKLYELAGKHLYMANLDSVIIDMPRRPPFSRGQLALLMLVDLAVEVGAAIQPYLPLLLQATFVQLDHFMTVVCEQSRTLLYNLVHALVPSISEEDEKTGGVLSVLLDTTDGKRLWAYEDITHTNKHIESLDQMVSLVDDVVDLLLPVYPEIDQKWGAIALQWATTCPVRHIACRSFQIFRILSPVFDQKMLGDLVHRLSNTISDSADEIQGFALEILLTLDSMLDNLEDSKAIYFPQFLWICIACLQGPHEGEFSECVRLLDKYLRKLKLTDLETSRRLLNSLSNRWKGVFAGIQPFLMRGMGSFKTDTDTLKLINLLLSVEDDFLIDSTPYRVLNSIVANFTSLLYALGLDVNQHPQTVKNYQEVAAQLAKLCDRQTQKYPKSARFFQAYADGRISTKEEFFKQFSGIVSVEFFSGQKLAVVNAFIALLSNPNLSQRRYVLRIIKYVLSAFDIEDLYGLEDDAILPLVHVLRTNDATLALEVIDELLRKVNTVQEANLKMVFGGKTIYRISKEVLESDEEFALSGRKAPTATGWLVLNYTEAALIARHNLDAVAVSCRMIQVGGSGSNTGAGGLVGHRRIGSASSTRHGRRGSSEHIFAKPSASLSQQQAPQQPLPAPPSDRLPFIPPRTQLKPPQSVTPAASSNRQTWLSVSSVGDASELLATVSEVDSFFSTKKTAVKQSNAGGFQTPPFSRTTSMASANANANTSAGTTPGGGGFAVSEMLDAYMTMGDKSN